jgi:hypothetical protein
VDIQDASIAALRTLVDAGPIMIAQAPIVSEATVIDTGDFLNRLNSDGPVVYK